MHSIFISDLWLDTALVRLAVRVCQMKMKLCSVSNLGRLAAHISQTNISLLSFRQSHPFARHQYLASDHERFFFSSRIAQRFKDQRPHRYYVSSVSRRRPTSLSLLLRSFPFPFRPRTRNFLPCHVSQVLQLL